MACYAGNSSWPLQKHSIWDMESIMKSFIVSFKIQNAFGDKVLTEYVWAYTPKCAVEKIQEKYVGVYHAIAKFAI
ncbi:hypothetical protein AP1_0128 [Aeromonas phage AP1]|nr:hypothetical protein AP1_0128 [Aeromonas phage AP1]